MIFYQFLSIFVYLIFAHFVADYPLQTDFLAKYKCRKESLAKIPWYYVMAGHCGTHAFFVMMITGNCYLAIAEFIAHYIIDVLKCENLIDIHLDQFWHIICKLIWTIVFVVFVLA